MAAGSGMHITMPSIMQHGSLRLPSKEPIQMPNALVLLDACSYFMMDTLLPRVSETWAGNKALWLSFRELNVSARWQSTTGTRLMPLHS